MDILIFDAVLKLVREAIDDGDKYGSRVISIASELAMKINQQPDDYRMHEFKILELLRLAINVGDPNGYAHKISRRILDLALFKS